MEGALCWFLVFVNLKTRPSSKFLLAISHFHRKNAFSSMLEQLVVLVLLPSAAASVTATGYRHDHHGDGGAVRILRRPLLAV